MCGIVGYLGERDSLPIILNGLKRLEYRGYDSSGVAIYNGSNIVSCKSYNNIDNTNIILPSLLFGNFNIFTDTDNKIILDENKY